MPSLPVPRGPLSHALLDALVRDPHRLRAPETPIPADPLADEDLQLALYLCYELHYRGLAGVAEEWEWEPSLLALRAGLEARFEAGLIDALGAPEGSVPPEEMDIALRAIEASDDAPSLSKHLEREGTRAQLLEFVVHRSAYQLKEADPHSWALPRLSGAPKAAMVEIQADEYGGGRADRIHAHLFAKAMRGLGLDATYGAYLDAHPRLHARHRQPDVAARPAPPLARRDRRPPGAVRDDLGGAQPPLRRRPRRVGAGDDVCDFFDEHVTADAVHESIAAVDLAGGLARQEPELTPQILWGARALIALEARWGAPLLEAWEEGRSSLLVPLARRQARQLAA